MTDYERSVIGLALTDLRSGVRPFDTEGIDSNNTSTSPKSYDVSYNPNGYRLVPLRSFSSPNKGGARECTYRIVAPQPDGDKVYEGT